MAVVEPRLPTIGSMEIHSVLPEERARTEKGEYLPWAYKYAEQVPKTCGVL